MTTEELDTIDRPGWAIHIEAAGEPGTITDDHLVDFLEALTHWSGVTSGAQDGSRYGATFSIDQAELPNIGTEDMSVVLADEAVRVFLTAAERAGLPSLPIVRAEFMTYEEQEADLRRPVIPELVGVSEIADILSVSRQRAHQLTKRQDFPEPIARLSSGPIWTRPSLTRFVEEWHSGKPDVTHELEELDLAIAELRDLRNDLVHGRASAEQKSISALAVAAITAATDPALSEQLGRNLRAYLDDMLRTGADSSDNRNRERVV